jgi:two-component system sensor histidine kinase/response regulator
MNAILGLLQLMQKTELDTRQRDYTNKTEGAARSLLGLLNDILDFSKVEAGKMTLELQPFRLDRLLSDLSVVLSSNVRAKNIEVLFDIDPTLPPVLLGDALRLQQVLINLGGNAVKFTSVGQVVIAVRKPVSGLPDGVEFAVTDTGIGIAPEHQSHIFTGFSQAEASTSRRFGGTGLGLAISQRLVQVMGGTLQLHSVLGEGSTFSFTVVLPEVHDVPADLQVAPAPAQGPCRVLVVDDNPVAGALLRRMVERLHWHAELVTSGEEGVARMQACVQGATPRFDLVLLDWFMPEGMDGWETAAQMRSWCAQGQARGIPPPLIIMVTANGREMLAQRTQHEQDMLNGFLVKPITASMLLDAVVDAKAGHSTLRRTARAASQRRLQGMRLLVVEDNLINQQVAEELLNSEGALVSLAANGQLGVDAVLAAQPQFDAVLMDVQMPVLDGYAAARLLRSTQGLDQLPIIAMTANAMESDRAACLAAGMNDHIGKPFDLHKLVVLLLRLTGHTVAGSQEPPSGQLPGAEAQPTSAGPLVSALGPTPGVELAAALVRMGGLASLYLRTAGVFAQSMPEVLAALDLALQAPDGGAAVMQMHTLKSTAATLGLQALAQEAARLEHSFGKLPFWQVGLEARRAQCDTLQRLCPESLNALQVAVTVLEQAMPQAPTSVVTRGLNLQERAALTELHALLQQEDFSALERFAELRSDLSALPEAVLTELESALQDLDLPRAAKACERVWGR